MAVPAGPCPKNVVHAKNAVCRDRVREGRGAAV